MMKKSFIALLAALMLAPALRADRGMWLPALIGTRIKDMRSKGFRLSAEDIYSVNKASLKDAVVLFNGGCTGELVSGEGLLLTNHHCGYGAIQSHSSVRHDYLTDGFWAMNRSEELPNPGLYVSFLVRMEDVTAQVLDGVRDDLPEARRDSLIRFNAARVADAAVRGTDCRADVEPFFYGNQYFLFVYRNYTDVRLVAAPPSSIGKFGGDTDNWMWPRHTGDFSVFRVYSDRDGQPAEYSKDNVPYAAPAHLTVSLKGYKPGSFAMIIGFPGSTERYKTSYEIDYTLGTDNPNRIFIRGERQKLMMEDMLASDEVRIQYASKYAMSSNYWKNSIGESRGLKKLKVRDTKLATEKRFTEWVNADPARKEKYGEALPLIRKAVEGRAPYMDRLQYFSETLLRGTEIIQAAGIARPLVGKDNRLDSSKLESVKKKLEAFYKDYSPSTDRKIAKRMFGILRDSIAPEHLPSSFVVIEEQFGGDVDAYVDYVYDNSAFADRSRAEALLASSTVEALLNDPAYKMRREVVKTYNALIDPINSFSEDFARGHRLYVAGLMEMDADRVFYPDANFTMRLTYGQVLPYEPQDAVSYNYFTTLDGVIAKEDPENAYEFSVPEKLKELYRTKDYGPYAEKGVLHVGFISNNDITGGNSGSPVMNAKGQLIGLAFDGNWEAMSGDIAFEPALQRTISVDIRYVLFIIDKYAGATWLIDEMTIVR